MTAAVNELIGAWSRRWFARAGVRAAPFADRSGAPHAARWHVLDAGLAIALPDGAGPRIAALVLGLDAAPADPGEADAALLARVADDCLDDLKQQLRALVRASASDAWVTADQPPERFAEGRTIELRRDDGPVLGTIAVTSDLFARLVAAALPPVTGLAPLARRTDALGRLPVALSALLGDCRLTVAELDGLAAGDVLVLDRGLDDPLPLAVGGEPKSGRCTVVQEDDGLAIKILQLFE